QDRLGPSAAPGQEERGDGSEGRGAGRPVTPERPQRAPQPAHIMKPRLVVAKFGSSGKTVFKSAGVTPNHVARAAPSCSVATVGTHRRRLSVSLGPESCSVGKIGPLGPGTP